ncbi:MAG: hypothetical protein Q8N35_08290 [Methylococcaceae bacterium]|nr:hypothetical protein [Methylococcaceae bacterium]MDZ4154907.1 hypothetical protein [Methylococcales bacterium]MDP2392466.1 hypothetical protein [Methylococcaceae bacterium]MDP3019572.1 hypothetical protein [Methylococcaceae bacterium]MDP3388350.1 hypothetical protein [Methylococcaceae bacterium]
MNATSSRLTITQYCFAIVALCVNSAAHAVHLDVEIWAEGNAMFAGFCRTTALGCDLAQLAANLQLPPNTLPKDGATGKQIFLSDFRDFSGGLYATPNPGFQSIQNALSPNEVVSYRALGVLEYWDPAISAWIAPATGTRVRLFGGLEASSVIINNASQCGGALFCFSGNGTGVEGSTIFTGNGIQGSPVLLVDAANSQGSLHTHMNFFLENQQGQQGGPVGAYLVEMEVFSNLHPVPSESFYVLFNAGLSANAYTNALLSLINTPPLVVPPPAGFSPVARAGSDRVVRFGSTVTLNGNDSHDPAPGPQALSYLWSQQAGPAVTIINGNNANATFLASKTGVYTFNLTVSDSQQSGSAVVRYTVPMRGDVDLDGDVDRIDVALILLAAQNGVTDPVGNDVRDIDGDRVVSRNDAVLAKNLCTLRLCRPTLR